MTTDDTVAATATHSLREARDRTHWLYLAVIAAVVAA